MKSWEEVIQVSDSFINTKNVKQRVRQDMHPSGVNFEAIGQLIFKINAPDPFYIYCVNNRWLNLQADHVFMMILEAVM